MNRVTSWRISLEGRVGEITVTFSPGVYLTEDPADQWEPHSTYLAEGGWEGLSLTEELLFLVYMLTRL